MFTVSPNHLRTSQLPPQNNVSSRCPRSTQVKIWMPNYNKILTQSVIGCHWAKSMNTKIKQRQGCFFLELLSFIPIISLYYLDGTIASFTQPANIATLLYLTFLYKSYEGSNGGCHCCSTTEVAREEVTAPNQHLWKKSIQNAEGCGVLTLVKCVNH